jgi:Tfp pilus assembly protein PilO
MKFDRRQLLVGALILMALLRVGDYVLSSMIQEPIRELNGENMELREEIKKQQALLAESREAGQLIEAWRKQSLPADTESARSLYRDWLLATIRAAKLRNATVDSGSPANRRGLYRVIPFNIQARGTLQQITSVLYKYENSVQLHRIINLRLTPVGSTGQFDLSMSVEALMVPGTKRTSLPTGESAILVSANQSDYAVIARDNIFGIGINQQDPMKLTILSAVTYRNGVPTAWITEQIEDRVQKLAAGTTFDTTALSGRVVRVDEKSVVIETGELEMTIKIGQSFAEASTTQLEYANGQSL